MKDYDWQKAKESLKHVYWLGGAASAGKTTISKRLSESHGMVRYDGDAHIRDHIGAAVEESSPRICAFRERGKNEKCRHWWYDQEPEKIARFIRDVFEEEFKMAVADLLAMPQDEKIVVDLFGGYPIPELLELTEPNRIIFLVATPAFQKEDYKLFFQNPKKREELAEHYSNPEELMENYVKGHLLLSRYVREECGKNNLPLLITGGNMSIDEVYSAVCKHFGLA